MRKVPDTKSGAVGAYNSKASTSITARRNALKFSIDTKSITAKGVVPIRGVNKYPEEPTIYFTREAWVKQCYLVEKCPKEVGWFALVDYDSTDNSFTITELVIPNQEVTSAETDIGKEDLADAAMELIEQGKDTGKMYAWFHSHVNMGVSPSAQDEFQVEDFLDDLHDQPEVPAFIRGIQNKKGDLKLDVYYVQHGIAYQNVEFLVFNDDDPQWTKDIDTEIKTKITERTFNYGNGYAATGGQKKGGVAKNATAWDDYDDYDIYGEYPYAEGAAPTETADPDFPEAQLEGLVSVEFTDLEYANMETIYSAPNNIDVMLDGENRLWVCSEAGDMYDYQEYTAACGALSKTGNFIM